MNLEEFTEQAAFELVKKKRLLRVKNRRATVISPGWVVFHILPTPLPSQEGNQCSGWGRGTQLHPQPFHRLDGNFIPPSAKGKTLGSPVSSPSRSPPGPPSETHPVSESSLHLYCGYHLDPSHQHLGAGSFNSLLKDIGLPRWVSGQLAFLPS